MGKEREFPEESVYPRIFGDSRKVTRHRIILANNFQGTSAVIKQGVSR